VFAYAVRRILTTIPLLLIGTFIIYALTSQVADPLAALRQNPNADQAAYDRIIELYSLDQSVPQRYLGWITNAIQGDMGTSPALGNRPVFDEVVRTASASARLAIPAFILIAVIAVVAGVVSAVNQYKASDYIITGVSFLGISMPTFVFGLLLQVIFVVYWQRWFGLKPFATSGLQTGSWTAIVTTHVLPVATLMLVIVAGESRFQRAAMLEVLNSDYIRTARAKGLPRRTVIFKHAMRNALIPLVTIWALDFAALLGGSVVTETIFSWPGIGRLLINDAIGRSDLNLLMGIILFVSTLVIVFNLLADLLYGVLDPRIRFD
jgi:peptide/nickel transport system permease protein